jgi:tRNA (adenine22-N1)-methyltransferase
MHKISKRLETIANYVKNDAAVCDIGTDHAYIPIYLAQNNKAKKIIASDINKGPLLRAQKNIESYLVSDKIETRISDGFSAFNKGEIDTAIIAGMGGELIAKILETDIGVKNFILQPQTAHFFLRNFLMNNNYIIKEEKIAKENKKMYTAIYAVRGKAPEQSRIQLEIGPFLIEKRPPLFKEYVLYRLYEIKSILNKIEKENINSKRMEELVFFKEEYEKLLEGESND